MNILQICEVFFIAGIVSYSLVPVMRKVAFRLNYIDHPKDNKVHAHPTPLLGGVAIFAAFLIATLTKTNLVSLPQVRAILAGCALLLVIGLIDDKIGMVPNIKLIGQLLASMLAIKAGVRTEFMGNYYLNVIFTYVWIVGITNAFNLLDNMNGLSAGIATVAAFFFGVLAYMNHETMICAVSFAIAGSTLGFLRYNFPKATIFMGDTGSLVLGYLLATVSILANWKTDTFSSSLLVPLLVLGYPIFDTTLVTIMRLIEGRSVFQGGKDHSSHRLALLGFKRYGAVLTIYIICVILGLGAIYIRNCNGRHAVLCAAVMVGAMMALGIRLAFVDTGRFGRSRRS